MLKRALVTALLVTLAPLAQAADLPPLSPEQKDTVYSTFMIDNDNSMALAAFIYGFEPSDGVQKDLFNRLAACLKSESNEEGKYGSIVDGADCPIAAVSITEYKGDERLSSYKSNSSLRVLDEAYGKIGRLSENVTGSDSTLVRTDLGDNKIQYDTTSTGFGAIVTSLGSMSSSSDSSSTMMLTSLEDGSVELDSLDLNMTSMMKFAGFDAELKLILKANRETAKLEVYLNGELISGEAALHARLLKDVRAQAIKALPATVRASLR